MIYPNRNCDSSRNLKQINIEATKDDDCWGKRAEGFAVENRFESYQFCRPPKNKDCVLMRVSRFVRTNNNASFDYTGYQVGYPTCRYRN